MMRPVVETVSNSNDSIRRQKWSPRDLVDWLKNSNLHFIISHVHQANLTNPPHWEARNVQRCLSSLGAHQGFPMGSKLKCPIFTQDKQQYINCMQLQSIAIPSIFVTLPIPSDFNYHQLLHFTDQHTTPTSCGFVVKLPFVTNSEALTMPRDFDATVKALEQKSQRYGREHGLCIPYAIVQPRLPNRKEYKVVLVNGKASHITSWKSHANDKAFSNREELFIFAEKAFKSLCEMYRQRSQRDSLV
jgi:hypothetical protein